MTIAHQVAKSVQKEKHLEKSLEMLRTAHEQEKQKKGKWVWCDTRRAYFFHQTNKHERPITTGAKKKTRNRKMANTDSEMPCEIAGINPAEAIFNGID